MRVWLWLLAAIASVGTVAAQEEPVFGYGDVVKKAEALAQQPFTHQQQQLSDDLLHLDYDLYRRIRFLPEHSVWPGLPYRLGFFHPGYNYNRRVLIHAIEPDRIRDIPFSPSYFHYDKPIAFSGREGFAGFKVFVPSVRYSGAQDEFLSFLGASYFRAIAKGLHWGLSSRGLGVNTGLSPEEFPDFREFWIRQPKPTDNSLQIYALLDSESITGGYRFIVRCGEATTMDVQATLFFRKKPQIVLLGPLTSMFYFGENTVNKPTLKPDYQPAGKTEFAMNRTDFKRREFRPEVHDSDGLLMETPSGEKLWAPLDNPKAVTVRRFSNVTSYSLVQRDRDLDHYLDLEAEYHRRPNLTVIPKSDFGPGNVRLLELPSADEYSDNMVAGWELDSVPDAGNRFEFAYQLVWDQRESDTSQFRVMSTTVNPNPRSGETRFTVEYAKPEKGETIPVDELRPNVVANQGGQVKDVQFAPTERGWLVSFTIYDPTPPQAMDISCVILRRDRFCSEKWLYLLNT
jgi:periplasmic glucans biosynthesis protein